MLALTDHLGQDVVDVEGRPLGVLRDLVVRGAGPAPPVSALVVDRARRRDRVPWERVRAFERSRMVAEPRDAPVAEPGEPAPRAGELLLARDVLDCQVVDIAGRRLARVGDVELERRGTELVVVAVDVGLAALARRLGLRRLARRLPARSLPWTEVHLATGRGHGLQLASEGAAVHRLSPGGLMQVVARLPDERGREVLQAVAPETAAEALAAASPDVAGRLLAELPADEAGALLERMPVDDAALALRGLAPERSAPLLERLPHARARRVRRLLEQAEGTAGAAMTPEVRTAPLGEPLERVRERVAAEPPPREGLLTVVPVDAERRPHGVISVASLLSGSGEPVPVPAVRADTPIETVLELFAAYDVLAVPVVDGDGRLIGAVAVDDVLDVLLADRLPGARRFRLLAARRRAPR